MLIDGRRAVLEPLIATYRPPVKMAPQNLRQTMERDPVAASGRSQMAGGAGGARTLVEGPDVHPLVYAQRLRTVPAPEGRVGLGMPFLDGTNIRGHHKDAGAPRKTTRPHKETSVKRGPVLGWLWHPPDGHRSALTAGSNVITDAIGRAVAFALAPVQDHELPHALPLLNTLPGVLKGMVAIRATVATPLASTSATWAHDR